MCGLRCQRGACGGPVLPPADLPEGLVAVHPLRGSGRCADCGAPATAVQEAMRKLAQAREQYGEARELLGAAEQLACGSSGQQGGAAGAVAAAAALLPPPDAGVHHGSRAAPGSAIDGEAVRRLGQAGAAVVERKLRAAAQLLQGCITSRSSCLHPHNMLLAQAHDLAAQVAQGLAQCQGAAPAARASWLARAAQHVELSVEVLQRHYPAGAPALAAQQAWLAQLRAAQG